MKFIRGASSTLFLFSVACLVGCGHFSPETAPRAVSYNRAVAEASTDILLLNIVRASDREPRYFSRLGSNSAQSTFNPTVGITVPFNGLVNGAVGTAAQIVATPQGTVQNSLTIDNLDDKKYMEGAVEQLSVSRLDHFVGQGFQRDLLGLLFFQSISIPASELQILYASLTNYCKGQVDSYCQSEVSLALAQKLDPISAPAACWMPNIVPTRSRAGGIEYITFINDPAAENLAAPGAAHSEFCFEIVLRGLLALGLRTTGEQSDEDVDSGLPNSIVSKPRFRSEMIKLGYEIKAEEPEKKTEKATYKITKKSSDTVLALDHERSLAVLENGQYTRVVCDRNYYRSKPKFRACMKKFRNSLKEYDSPDSAIPIDALHIMIPRRSFESMIYFLGQVVRTQDGNSGASSRIYKVLVLGRQPWDPSMPQSTMPSPNSEFLIPPISRYEEILFDLRSNPPSNPVFEVSDDKNRAHWIPGFCSEPGFSRALAKDAAKTCSIEYPNHETMVVLTILNQLWALQKEPSEEPVKTVTVGGGG